MDDQKEADIKVKGCRAVEVKICLCVMCGIPASGKSSFCERFSLDMVNNFFIVNVNYDRILLSQHSDAIKFHESLLEDERKAEDGLFKTARQQLLSLVEMLVKHLRELGHGINFQTLNESESFNQDIWTRFLSHLEKNCADRNDDFKDVLILLDDNMYLNSMRYDVYKLARKYHTGFCEVFMEFSLPAALERNSLRLGREFVQQDIIKKMAERLEPPDPVKNHWEKYHVKLESGETVEKVLLMIKQALADPVQPLLQKDKEEQALSQVACSKSIIHQADLILRKCVAKAIARGKMDSVDLRSLSRQAMSVKEDLLCDLKSGRVRIELQEQFIVEDASKDESSVLYNYVFAIFNEKLKS